MKLWMKKKEPEKTDIPEKLRYSRYYEHDGALRAYANRAMILAFLCVPITLLALGFAVYVRLQPPTVIRVDANGEATVLGRPSPRLRSSAARRRHRQTLRNVLSCGSSWNGT